MHTCGCRIYGSGDLLLNHVRVSFSLMAPSVNKFTFARYGGYECSSKGDKRFSAFYAVMSDGRTIEQHYQCDVKGYQPGGTDWTLGKGKPPLNKEIDLWSSYLALWETWASNHPELLYELANLATQKQGVLSDMFATTSINQARALVVILNKLNVTNSSLLNW